MKETKQPLVVKSPDRDNSDILKDSETACETKAESSYPILLFLKSCIERDVFTPYSSSTVEIEGFLKVNRQKLHELKREFIQSTQASTQQERIRPSFSIELPEDFNWEQETQKGVRKAIWILYKEEVVSLQTLVNTTRYAGPGNVVVTDNDESSFSNLRYNSYATRESREFPSLRKSLFEIAEESRNRRIPPPETRDIRNKYIDFSISKEVIKVKASDYLHVAQNQGLEMSVSQALELALTVSGGHEYAHAMEEVLLSDGKSIYERVQSFESRILFDKLRKAVKRISMEHFAVGIEDIIRKKALAELGYSEEQISKFETGLFEQRSKTLEQIEDVLQIGQSKDLSPVEVWHACVDYISSQLINLTCYHTPPFTKEQIKALTG